MGWLLGIFIAVAFPAASFLAVAFCFFLSGYVRNLGRAVVREQEARSAEIRRLASDLEAMKRDWSREVDSIRQDVRRLTGEERK